MPRLEISYHIETDENETNTDESGTIFSMEDEYGNLVQYVKSIRQVVETIAMDSRGRQR